MTPFFLGTKERATFFHLQQNTHSSDRYQSIKLFHRNCQTPKVLITTKSSIFGKEATKKDPPRWKGFFNRTPTEPRLELTIISWKNMKTRWDPHFGSGFKWFPPLNIPSDFFGTKQRHEIRTSSQLMLDSSLVGCKADLPTPPGMWMVSSPPGMTERLTIFFQVTRNPWR